MSLPLTAIRPDSTTSRRTGMACLQEPCRHNVLAFILLTVNSRLLTPLPPSPAPATPMYTQHRLHSLGGLSKIRR